MHAVKDVFGIVDSLVFAVMLIISASAGVWYAIKDRKKQNSEEYLMGGRSLSVFPVAMSAWHGFMSAIALLGSPSEVYTYGTQIMMMSAAFFLVVPVTAYFYLPVYYNLKLTSAYEYLGLRFHPCMRTIGSVIYLLHMTMYMPVALYAPALALSEVTGIKIWTAVLSTGLVCTFYTCIGGVKAVVWTDAFQSVVMVGSVLTIVIKGAIDVGGFDVVWQRSQDSGRIEFFRYDIDPTIRYTIWTLVIGNFITWTGNYAASQSMVQRYLTVKSLRKAKQVLWLNLPALLLVNITAGYAGLVIYAYYYDCDPIGTKLIKAPDQLFPRFVMETLGSLPGLPGFFVAGVFSGAISTVATGTNSLAAILLEDFVKVFIANDLSEKTATRVSKCITLSFGLLTVALTFVADKIGGVLQAALTIHGIVGGPMLGVFTLGMFFPCANAIGSFFGLLSGLSISMWLAIGAFIHPPFRPEAPVSYKGCVDLYFNVTGIDATGLKYMPQVIEDDSDIFYMYRISYFWFCVISFIAVIVVGIFVSLVTGCRKGKPIDETLITPVVVYFCKTFSCGNFIQDSSSTNGKKSFSMDKTKEIYDDDDFSRRASISSILESKTSHRL